MSAGPVIVGNALAGLVAAAELARAGREVTLINPGGPWGGYFAGVTVDGAAWDAGMVVLEFTAFAHQAGREALATYDPAVRNDIGRFARLVGDWLEARFPTRVIDPPRMRVAGVELPDLIMGNELDALRRLPFADAARADLARLPDPGPLHARQKAQGPAYADAGFEAASRANHGAVLHERLFQPFLDKVFGDHAASLLARYHRIPWLPLYWPETLRAVLDGAAPPIAPSPLSYPAGASVAEVVRALVAELEASPRVRMLTGPITGVSVRGPGGTVRLADGTVVVASRLAWAHAPSALIEVLGGEAWRQPLRRAPLALAFFTVAEDAVAHPFSVLQLVEPSAALYRITDLAACAGQTGPRRWVVELNLDVFAARHGEALDDAALPAAVARELADLGLADLAALRPAGVKRVPGGFAVPDAEALEAWVFERGALDRLAPGVTLMAAGSGFMVTSLSDQVVQGLKFADEAEAAAHAA